MKVRICIPFYIEYQLHQINDVLWDIIRENNLESKKSPNESGPRWFKYEDIEFHVEPRRTTRIKIGRNSLISDVFDHRKNQQPLKFDVFHTLDTDTIFTLNQMVKNVRSDKDIIGSGYPPHTDPTVSNVSELGENGEFIRMYRLSERGLKKVDGLPGGFMSIKRRVFEETPYPWFREPLIEWGNGEFCEELGEDYGFCLNAKAAGFDIWCDFDNSVQHRKRIINWSKKKMNDESTTLLRQYYNESLNFQKAMEKKQAQIIAVAEVMKLSPDKVNELLGANVMSVPAPETETAEPAKSD